MVSIAEPSKEKSRSKKLLRRLGKVESPNVTYMGEDFPIVMHKGDGLKVTDVDGKRYLDFTACFGVLALGHRPKTTLTALRKQSAKLIHGMGDVHPTESKIKLLETIAKVTPFFTQPKSILSLNGGDAVESALKTAIIVTGRSKFLSFQGGYHGLQFGPLSLISRPLFKEPFANWYAQDISVEIPFPSDEAEVIKSGPNSGNFSANEVLEQLENQLKTNSFAALIMEPLQGRGGERTYPAGFLKSCRELTQKYKTLLIFDEIYTGFGRTGDMFALEHENVVPDLLCVGKAMGGGLPLSACTGDILDAWGKSSGEARHTSTFLGHPLACAVATETIKSIARHLPQFKCEASKIDKKINQFSKVYENSESFSIAPFSIRGRGFMLGFWFYGSPAGYAAWLAEQLLQKGFILLPSGPRGDVLSFTPPLIVKASDFSALFENLQKIVLTTPAHLRAQK